VYVLVIYLPSYSGKRQSDLDINSLSSTERFESIVFI
jgi:hypothetical protein